MIFVGVFSTVGACLLGRWPSKAREEIPDCNLLTCSFGDDENVFSEGQEQIVNIYEAGEAYHLCG